MKNFKKLIILAGAAGFGLFLNSCSMGYVATEPSYVEVSRPPRPSETYVWIDGNWVYNHQNQGYVHSTGYWQQPSSNRTYVSGHWQSSPRGNYWVSGRWQNNKKQQGRNSR